MPHPAFLSLAAAPATSPHQSSFLETNEVFDPITVRRIRREACVLSHLQVVVDRHDGEEAGRRQLLAVHGLR